MLKGFIFDLDGVITDTAQFHYQAWKKIAKDELGITIDPSVNEELKGVSRMDSLAVILKFGHQENAYTQAQKIQITADKNNYYVSLISKMTPKDILPGMQQLLDEVKAGGCGMALASASRNAPRILAGLGLTAYFDAIVDPATLHKGKPDPEIFTRGAELLKIAPSEAVGIEDAAAGIQAIKAAGEFAVGIGEAQVLHQADLNFTATSEVRLDTIIQAFNKQA